MTADLRELNGASQAPAEGGTLGAQRRGAPAESVPHPPAPPPASRRLKAKRTARAWVQGLPFRYQLIGGAVIVVGCTVLATRLFVHPVDEDAIAQTAAERAYASVSAELDQAKAESTQIAVPSALSWATCPLTNEARVMIGGEARTGGKTLNEQRAGVLDTQARALLQTFTMADLRLTAPSQSELRIVAADPSVGVPMFNCLAGNVAPTTSTTAAAS